MLAPRPLGSTGLDVSPLGLGTVKLGRNVGVKYPEVFELPGDEQARALLADARALGINLLDTAPAYGSSEERLGTLIEGQRDAWVLSTKVGEEFDITSGSSSYRFDPEWVGQSVRRSLERLRTDVLDLVLIHSDGRDEWILRESGAVDALRDLQGQGLIRAIGASTKSPDGGTLAAELCDVIMVTLNERERDDLPAIERARDRGVGVLIKKALASGHAASPLDAMRLCLGEAGADCVVVGSINPVHLRANAEAAERALS